MGDRRLTVMVVDDHPVLRDAYTIYLQSLGHTVLTAADGCAALELLRAGAAPDLILLDLSMPQMTGWEFRTAQRADPRLDRIPVIVLSSERLSPAEIDRLGCCGVLRKPSPAETILAALARGRRCAAHRATGATTPLPPARWTGRPEPALNTASCDRGP